MKNIGDSTFDRTGYSSWDEFDPCAYVCHNYNKMMPEDRKIISIISNELCKMDIPLDHFKIVGDIGTGPNLYPAILIAPYVSEMGQIELIEPSLTNRNYLKCVFNSLSNDDDTLFEKNWCNYECKIIGLCGDIYKNAFKRLQRLVTVKNGSIYHLPKNKYDFVSSYFVAESISDCYLQFQLALNKIVDSVIPGGVIVTTHMLYSEGYQAGKNTKFPAVNISLDHIRESLIKTGLKQSNFKIWPVLTKQFEEKVRDGYQGMAVVIASKNS